MRYAVIMAGGAGQRLWPLSRLMRPKQLLPLIGGKSLLALAAERLAELFEPADTLIVTNASYADQVAAELPNVPPENIIGEPEGRDTANAIALATVLLAARDESATMGVFTADHVIRPPEPFLEAVRAACRAAEEYPEALLTFGVRPSWPHPGLGYIHYGQGAGEGLYEVLAFREKPDHATARRYVESGRYFWNSGMFVWKVSAIRDALERFLPDSMRRLAPVGAAAAAGDEFADLLRDIYPHLQRISIDYAVMEKADKVLMVELACEWMDVGSYPALEKVCNLDDAGNLLEARRVLILDSFRNIVVSDEDHLLAVLGMDDCIIAHSADATLVCSKKDDQRVKELVALLQKHFGDQYQ